MLTEITFLPKNLGPITFYALFILLGALLALVLSKKRVKDRGYNPSDIDNLFLLAFPMGLVGARLWYYVFQFHEFNTGEFWTTFIGLFGFINGQFVGISGLAIQGGVLFGVISGMIFVHARRKHMRLLDIADAAVPTILLAQAIGRFGNFFNREVYGFCVESSSWSWLGQWFVNQMSYDGSTNAFICTGEPTKMALPLFLIEGLINVAGYFILTQLVDRFTKGKDLKGTVTFSYFIWYGIVRLILEPLRNSKFIMEVDGSGVPTSRITAIVFIIVGALLVASVFINKYVLKPRNRHFGMLLARYEGWFNSLSRVIRIVIEVIPVTAWINSVIYRFSKDNFTWGVLCIFLGPIFWLIDLCTMIIYDKIILFADGKGLLQYENVAEVKKTSIAEESEEKHE